ncbi:MAG: hypothetical protein M1821_008827 [Bathelium mastoideum]|nr:MAG: hypothetical protein M1821_008827 [Bathelium mastoideum]
MSTILRTLRNLRRIGLKEYGHQMQYIGDTKAGTFIAKDRYGNKYYENLEEELPLRTRWVDYHDKEYDPSQIEPGWHAWMSYMVDKPPSEDPINQTRVREWEPKEHRPTLTWTRSAYRPYSTYVESATMTRKVRIPKELSFSADTPLRTKNKYSAWVPEAKPRT